ncbi:MAG: hypothetical protein U1U88_002174 [Lawsonella clevelandensis]
MVRGEDATINELIAQVVGAERWASTAMTENRYGVAGQQHCAHVEGPVGGCSRSGKR